MIVPGIIFGFIMVKLLDVFFKLGLEYYLYSVVFSLIPQLDFAITFFYEKNRFDFKEFLDWEKKGGFLHNINGVFIFLVIGVFIFLFHEKLALVFLLCSISGLIFDRIRGKELVLDLALLSIFIAVLALF